MPLEAPAGTPKIIRKRGVYLITGGLGGIGLTLAEYLARSARCRLILTGRTPLPDRNRWQQWLVEHEGGDEVSQKIKKVILLERLGAEVMVLSADVTDEDQMRVVVNQARERFGVIHGAIHAAGIAGEYRQHEKPGAAASVLAPKVKGAQVLDAVLAEENLDLLVLCSSLASVVGLLGRSDYCAANAFLDAFGQRSRNGTLTICINWDTWKDVGMAARIPAANLKDAILPSEGMDVFGRILHAGLPRVVVSTKDLASTQDLITESVRSASTVGSAAGDDSIQAERRSTRARYARPLLSNKYVEARNPLERSITSIWQSLLGFERIGIHDNFFELGGESLLGTRVCARIAQALQVELPPGRLFETPTIAGLSIEISRLRGGTANTASAGLKPIGRRQLERLPLSFSQNRLWFLEQMDGDRTAYNMPFAYRLLGSLDVEALRQALEGIVQRHEPLRTTFVTVAGEPLQVIGTDVQFSLPVEDLSGLAKDRQAEQIVMRCAAEAERRFDLAADLMLRTSLLRLAADEHVLLLTMHHIATDGWSLPVLWRDLELLYAGFRDGLAADLPELTAGYADYTVWQRIRLQGQRLDDLLRYWRNQLDRITTLALPTDRPRPPISSSQGAEHTFEVREDLVERLRALGQAEGVTLHMTLLAAFQVLLARYSGQDDIAIGTPIAGRSHADVENQIGFFVNTLVLRTDLSGDPTFREFLARVGRVSLAAYDHQELPFEKLVEELRPERHLSSLWLNPLRSRRRWQ